MPREILFRGKPLVPDAPYLVRNPEVIKDGFIYGYVSFFDGVYSITPMDLPDDKIVLRPSFKVIPETVGQFTGFIDKNGTKIFEGDIIRWDSAWNYEVFWDAEYCGFDIRANINDRYDQDRLGNLNPEFSEVIDNIYSNTRRESC